MIRRGHVGVLIAAVLVLTACNPTGPPNSDETSAPGAEEQTEGGPSQDEVRVTEPDTVDDEGAGSNTGNAGAAENANCPVGDWVLGSGSIATWYGTVMSGNGISVSGASGEFFLSFSTDEFIIATQGVSIDLSIDGQEATATMAGASAGTYWLGDAGVMSTQIVESDLGTSVRMAGIDFQASDIGLDLVGLGSFAGYECSGSQLILETAGNATSTAFLNFESAG